MVDFDFGEFDDIHDIDVPRSSVWCPDCDEEHDTEEVEFLDISEGMQGEDRMTFKCPESLHVFTSTVYGRR